MQNYLGNSDAWVDGNQLSEINSPVFGGDLCRLALALKKTAVTAIG